MAAEKLILFFAAIFLFQQNVYGFNGNRIVGGTATPDGVFKFLPRLTMAIGGPGLNGTESDICSSTIISSRHILTAAHCIHIGMGLGQRMTGEAVYRAQGVFIHYRPKYKVVEVKGALKAKKFYLDLHNYAVAPRIYVHPSYSFTHFCLDDIAIIEFPEGTNLNIT
uniref:Peptidase S1 domain-containing protein n=1 Tax=Panagrolaimus sp. PS1159 TaxID=55785 RepID=A0AC35GK87_9BILA